MSHFSVLVRVPAETKLSEIEAAVGRCMDPYCEHDDRGRLAQYMKFKDITEEERERYLTQSVTKVKLVDGSLHWTWDKQFNVDPNSFAVVINGERKYPPGAEEVEIPFKDLYPTFEAFMSEYVEDKPREDGRYGYMHNPNAKWDYWRIGGRWRGRLPLLPGPREADLTEPSWEWQYSKEQIPGDNTHVDVCRIKDLNHDEIKRTVAEKVEKFWAEVDQLLSGKKFPSFEGPRDVMLDVGMLDCFDGEELPENLYWKEKWSGDRNRYDVVLEKPTREAFQARLEGFFNPVRCYAFVDHKGWRSPGRMGMFGMGSDTADSRDDYNDIFAKWLASGDQRDWIAVVDCHI